MRRFLSSPSEPPKTNFENLDDLLHKTKGMHLDASSSGALAKSLDKCVDPKEPAFNTLVRILATRCMLSAEYFCSGSVSRDSFLHYGLAAPIYTRTCLLLPSSKRSSTD